MCPEAVSVEFIMLADHAEVMNGKLYMMGGGYDRRFINDINSPVTLVVVVSVSVPWNLTNQPHTVKIRVETEDGAVVVESQGDLTVGRSAEAIPGQLFRVMSVINFTAQLPQFGGYQVIAALSGGESRSINFYAVSSDAAFKPAG